MFSIFRKKSPSPALPSEPQKAPHAGEVDYKTPEFADRLRQFALASKFLYRDTDLTPEVLRLYQPGLFFRDPTFFDTTHRFGGPIGNTRFIVVTATPRDISMLSETPEWGLCVFPPNELFKVVDVLLVDGLTQVTVLHIPPDCEAYFRSVDASFFEAQLTPRTRADFQEAIGIPKISVHASTSWRQRTAHPPGLSNDGVLIGSLNASQAT